MQGPITLEMVLAFLTVTGAIGGVWWRIEAKFASVIEEFRRDRTALANDLARIRDDLANYKLYVAQTHVSVPTLKETEERLINAIEKLFETLVARIEKIPTR